MEMEKLVLVWVYVLSRFNQCPYLDKHLLFILHPGKFSTPDWISPKQPGLASELTLLEQEVHSETS